MGAKTVKPVAGGFKFLEETRIGAREAAKMARTGRLTLKKWLMEGVNGVHLEGALIGVQRRLVTSKEAVLRFLKATNKDVPAIAREGGE